MGWKTVQTHVVEQQHHEQEAARQYSVPLSRGNEAGPIVTAETLESRVSRCTECYTQAMGLLRDKAYDRARMLFMDALKDCDPHAPGRHGVGGSVEEAALSYLCLKNIASIAKLSGDTAQALHSYCRAAEIDDTDGLLWFEIARNAAGLGRLVQARVAIEQSLHRNPKHSPSLLLLVCVCADVGDEDGLWNACGRLLRLQPRHPLALQHRNELQKNRNGAEYARLPVPALHVQPAPATLVFFGDTLEWEIPTFNPSAGKLGNAGSVSVQFSRQGLTWERIGRALLCIHGMATLAATDCSARAGDWTQTLLSAPIELLVSSTDVAMNIPPSSVSASSTDDAAVASPLQNDDKSPLTSSAAPPPLVKKKVKATTKEKRKAAPNVRSSRRVKNKMEAESNASRTAAAMDNTSEQLDELFHNSLEGVEENLVDVVSSGFCLQSIMGGSPNFQTQTPKPSLTNTTPSPLPEVLKSTPNHLPAAIDVEDAIDVATHGAFDFLASWQARKVGRS
jgi:tetratricopeptide (TPR) repeat protein